MGLYVLLDFGQYQIYFLSFYEMNPDCYFDIYFQVINTYWLYLIKTVCFVNPRLPMFVAAKASETPTVEGFLNTVLQGT